jgi:conjugal transfer/entry exclusion protein
VANNKIEAIKNRVDNLKDAAEDLKNNATNIRELDVTGTGQLRVKMI